MKCIGYIERAIDGDTLQVTLEGSTIWDRQGAMAYATKWRRNCKLRLLDVNTAEIHAKDSNERERAQTAHLFTKNWLDGVSYVDVEYDETNAEDSFGRVLATVLYPQSGESLNLALLAADLAVPFTKSLDGALDTLQPVSWS